MPSVTAVWAVTAVFIGLWLLQLTWRIRWARGPKPAPRQPTGEYAGLSPALVQLLTAGRGLSEDAVAATVIDLAARRFVDIEEVGPKLSLIRLRRHDAPLRPYEQQVLDHLRGLADSQGVVATNALAEGSRNLDEWWEAFKTGVVDEARHLTLTRKVRGFGSGMSITGMIAFGLLGLAVDMVVLPWRGEYPTGALIAPIWFAGMFVMTAFDRKLSGERLTRTGRVAAGQWLAEREHLKGIANIERLPAAAVVIWGRPFAHAAAMGLSRSVASLPVVVPKQPTEAWSDQGGLWHKVRINYPNLAGRGSTGVIVGLVFLSWAAATLGASLWYATHDFRIQDWPPALFSLIMLPAGGLAPLVLIIVLGWPLGLIIRIRWRAGSANPAPERMITGKVLRRMDLPFTGQERGFVYVAIDDGRPSIDAVRATADRVGSVREGEQVRAWVSRAGFLARLELVSSAPSHFPG